MNASTELLKIKAELSLKNNEDYNKERAVIDLLENEFPMMQLQLEKVENSCSIYKTMECFADVTKELIHSGNFKEVKHCFNIAEKMLRMGNCHVKNAIENVYLFSISRIISMANPVSYTVKNLLTESLKKEYNRQICASGI
ncbi:MAG TPA: hypothetical protein VN026_07255 [Bacteroidia bacterium]|jgi:hypothetical protein|nr:hypothetical protein [Bacteroidia bacterium]